MKQIKLTRGQVALVDDADYDWLNQWKWHASFYRGIWYAERTIVDSKDKKHTIRMHRVILGLELRDKRQADHVNHVTLDNRRYNLRVCTRQQNNHNMSKWKNPTFSKYKGVSFEKRRKKWRANIHLDNKCKHVGYFDLEIEAAKAYNKAAIELFGEFAYLNKIGDTNGEDTQD